MWGKPQFVAASGLLAALQLGCGARQPPIVGTWIRHVRLSAEAADRGQDYTVKFVFGANGSYVKEEASTSARGAASAKVLESGSYSLTGKSLTLDETEWWRENPNQGKQPRVARQSFSVDVSEERMAMTENRPVVVDMPGGKALPGTGEVTYDYLRVP